LHIPFVPEEKIGHILRAVDTVIHPQNAHTTHLAMKLTAQSNELISDADLYDWLHRLVGAGLLKKCEFDENSRPDLPPHHGLNLSTHWHKLTDEGEKVLRAWKESQKAAAKQNVA
jgi:DNA-binding PadR family transcriptional regulator